MDVCETCSKTYLLSYCLKCHKTFCKQCVDDHKKRNENHIFKLPALENKSTYCTEHIKEFTLLCSQCVTVMCRDCNKDKHVRHQILLLSDVKKDQKNELEASVKSIAEKIKKVKYEIESKKNVIKSFKTDVSKAIDTLFKLWSRINIIINSKIDELQKNADNCRSGNKNLDYITLLKQINTMEMSLQFYKTIKENMECVLMATHDCQFVFRFYQNKRDLNKYTAEPDDVEETPNLTVRYVEPSDEDIKVFLFGDHTGKKDLGNECDSSKAIFKKALEENEDHKTRMKDLQKESATAKYEAQKALKESQDLNRRIKELEKERDSSQEISKKALTENQDHKTRIKELEKEYDRNKEIYKKALKENEDHKTRIKDLQNECAAAKYDTQKSLKENEDLKTRMRDLQKAKENHSTFLRENEDLKTRIKELEKECDSSKEISKRGLKENEDLKTRMNDLQKECAIAKYDMQKALKENEGLKTRMKDLQKAAESPNTFIRENEELNKRIKDLEKESDSSKEISKQAMRENEDHKTRITDIQKDATAKIDKQKALNENEDLKTRIKDLQKECDRTKEISKTSLRENEYHKTRTEDLQRECASAKNDTQKALKEIEDLNSRIRDLQNGKETPNTFLRENEDLKTRIKDLEKECDSSKQFSKKALNENEDQKTRIKDLQKEYDTAKIVMQKSLNENEDLKRRIVDLQRECDIAKNYTSKTLNENENLKTGIKNLQKKCDMAEGDIRKTQKENEELKTRLSQVAGAKLVAGNSSIADLGDMYRPTRIAELYFELYDNEWTEAVDELVNEWPEDMVVRHLFITLQGCYKACIEVADCQKQDLIQKMFLNMPDVSNLTQRHKSEVQQLLNARKGTGVVVGSLLHRDIYQHSTFIEELRSFQWMNEDLIGRITAKTFFEKCALICWLMAIQDPPMYLDDDLQHKTQFDKDSYREYTKSGAKKIFDNQHFKTICSGFKDIEMPLIQDIAKTKYFEKCVMVCWLMVVQDPAMYLDNDIKPGSPFSRDHYREFTKNGNIVEYTVWPALFLHKGGPLLKKGVVQLWKQKELVSGHC